MIVTWIEHTYNRRRRQRRLGRLTPVEFELAFCDQLEHAVRTPKPLSTKRAADRIKRFDANGETSTGFWVMVSH